MGSLESENQSKAGKGDSGKHLVACASFIEIHEEAAKARAAAQTRALADFAMAEAKAEAAERAARDRAAALEAQERACVEIMRSCSCKLKLLTATSIACLLQLTP